MLELKKEIEESSMLLNLPQIKLACFSLNMSKNQNCHVIILQLSYIRSLQPFSNMQGHRVCMCMHVSTLYIDIYICIYIHRYIHTYLYIYIYIHIHIDAYIYIHRYIHTYLYIYICMYVCMYMHMYMCICVCMYI